MMNRRTRKPPASTINGTASHHEIPLRKWMPHHNATYGISVLVSCHKPRGTEGFWYFATIAFHAGAWDAPSVPAFELIMVVSNQTSVPFRFIPAATELPVSGSPIP